MLRLLTGRALDQWRLLGTLLAVVAVGATLLGTCALLVTRTADRALEVAASRATAADTAVTAYTVTIKGGDAASVAADTRDLLTTSLLPFPSRTTGRASSVMRYFENRTAAYFSAVEDLPGSTELVTGRWPAKSGEAAILDTTARQLGLSPGDRVRLGGEMVRDPAPATRVTVVGVVRPLAGAGWDRDPLGGAGFDLAFRDARASGAYGPFLVGWDDLLAGASTLDRLEITAQPGLSAPRLRDLDTVTGVVAGADRRLARILGDRVQIERIASDLPSVLRASRHQQQVTNAAVLAVAVLGGILTATALALAGRLTTDLRAGETTLLSSFGTSRAQLTALAVVEAVALALLSAAIALPASTLLHAALTRMPPLAGAGLTEPPAVTGAQMLAVGAGAVVLAVILLVAGLRTAADTGERTRRDLLARSGADLLLVALAAGGWWQLRAQPSAGDSGSPDVVRVLAPALLLVAGAALALRLAPPALALADRVARRADSLPLPLAAFEAARRPQATAAGLLVVLACAAGTFGIALDATWERSQRDQAALAVGTDLTLALTRAPSSGQGAEVAAATGGTVSPAVDRGVSVGQWLGGDGAAPRLVAVDADRAGSLLRGRLDEGRTWADVGAKLAAPPAAPGIPLTAVPTLTGTASGDASLTVTPELLLEDATGLRTTCAGAPLPLDGEPHRLGACVPLPDVRVVAVALPMSGDSIDWDAAGDSDVSVTLDIPGSSGGAGWTATSAPPSPEQLMKPQVATGESGLTMTGTVVLGGPPEAPRELVATAFADPGFVPVAVSAGFAEDLGVRVGAALDLTVGLTAIRVKIADLVPSVPAAPGGAAMLADLDTLSRALAVRGDLASPVDAWWVGDPDRTDLTALHLGEVVTRAGEIERLTAGPVPAGLPAVLRLLVPAAVVLLLAGLLLHVTCDLQVRALEVARLRGLGMTRREIRRTLLGQHALVLLPLLTAGAVVGALATWLVAPLLVRSEEGAAPVPQAVPTWPWPAEAGLLLTLLAGCLLAVTAVVVIQSRRADAAHLRVAS
ncbi:hypothetical protein ACTI_43080 [Actinoplanes sp. OR16]|uniref:FtsX-like permease family protein n=1 Tax=Actinoplanes sp. OR16 TaxID=946334 RepID=UPI000F70412C|nr:ABC transporter permease [Actinoplanes sp. OR16]BBH67623.1 hypothetical protein ACTI_43080 [Actinoplanes sp. OR16]